MAISKQFMVMPCEHIPSKLMVYEPWAAVLAQ